MSLQQFLTRSRASDAFKDAVVAFARSGQPNDRIGFNPYCPPVKVERTLIKLLEELPEVELERVEVRGSSGCEFFRGELSAFAGSDEHRVRFHWDCKWKAVQHGWTDYFGFPDQARAAREFGHDCFREWEVQQVEAPLEVPMPA